MTQTELLALAKSCGFTASAPLDPASIELKQAVRDMCQENTCGQYGKRWSCPPGCGDLEQCRTQLAGYSTGLLVQTTGAIEDSFDFEGIQDIEQQHKRHFDAMHEALRPLYPKLLPLGAGCCTRCKDCTYPDAPCRFPEKMVSSMEAYGMLVLEICKANSLSYYYGADTMTYTSCFLLF